MTKTLSITKAREDLTNLVDRANRLLDEFVITVNGSPAAVIMSAAEYESWKETNEIMSDPGLMKSIRKGEKELNEGKGLDWEEVKKELKLNVQD
ncbi:MAG: Prevent-host-death family protein [Microgenomates group bacterium GW2011_GWC1_39_7b]|uniref:Antitoxin n=3 Tax=Candidatus Woeseibacteriota TaxID=1752722 RepID=A0A0G0PS91_9BACT|nr:MAG: Prevent-host-death family protein [Candidatus Woesebacteria bacterium GW2011_GWB1_39_10]KKR26930.1 MAG: Prevent-host-death family protein [Microgenomates group bacterium GW2011_GWC1_39_7b]KKR72942.1 MAG: Prevent-host-death family protein [Candidatus Woesebacteria bacterium GW2011_GWA2_40_7]KKS91171.1 MAG: Prevent-host-death family protein [Candidatus Woesebacteria bacterium GW2011_GWA1_43_12]